MKVKCKDCGYTFQAELYSGLCPRCGAFTPYQEQDTSEGSPDKEENLEIPPEWRPGTEQGTPRAKRPIPVLLIILIIWMVVLPIGSLIVFRVWSHQYFQSALDRELVQETASDGVLTFDGRYMEYPLTFTLLEAGRVETGGLTLPKGMSLLAVRVRAQCGGYESVVYWKNPCLKYERNGETCYREAENYYSFPDHFFESGFSSNDLLRSYCPGLEKEEGYLLFFFDEDAQNPELVWTLQRTEEPNFAVAQGTLPLGQLDTVTLRGKEDRE